MCNHREASRWEDIGGFQTQIYRCKATGRELDADCETCADCEIYHNEFQKEGRGAK